MVLPTLYKKSANGKILEWRIAALESVIITHFGQRGGVIQTTREKIDSGKNHGRANETTAEEQAQKEARSRWEKKVKSGYCRTAAKAKMGEVEEDVVTGGIPPMLAHKYEDWKERIEFPIFVQPKLDGMRAIWDGNWLYSRNRRKHGKNVEPIVEAIRQAKFPSEWVLDGEIYNHDFKDKFEELMSSSRKQKERTAQADLLQYHIYDIFIPGQEEIAMSVRSQMLATFMAKLPFDSIRKKLVLVPTFSAAGFEDLDSRHKKFLKEGYEGSIIRAASSPYQCKRSPGLLKRKEFQDAEFPIVGVFAGRGKMAGKAIFTCSLPDDEETTFDVKLKGSMDGLKKFLKDPSTWRGKFLKVQFMGYTNKVGVPRHPVGLGIREGE